MCVNAARARVLCASVASVCGDCARDCASALFVCESAVCVSVLCECCACESVVC